MLADNTKETTDKSFLIVIQHGGYDITSYTQKWMLLRHMYNYGSYEITYWYEQGNYDVTCMNMTS